MLTVRPGEIALVVAADGEAIPSERILAREVDSDDFPERPCVPRERRREGASARVPHCGYLPNQPGAVPDRDGRQRGRRGPARLAGSRCSGFKPTRWASSRCSTGNRLHRETWRGLKFQGPRQLPAGAGRSSTEGVPRAARASVACGSWNLNPWFVRVEMVPMTEIPIGYVGVVVSYVGREHVDLSGDDFHSR